MIAAPHQSRLAQCQIGLNSLGARGALDLIQTDAHRLALINKGKSTSGRTINETN